MLLELLVIVVQTLLICGYITQVLVPNVRGTHTFPLFRRESKTAELQERLTNVNQEAEDWDVEHTVLDRESKLQEEKNEYRKVG